MQKTYLANIKIPFTIEPDGSMTPHQDRYAIDFQSIDELPPINQAEYGALLQQLLSSSNVDVPASENNTITPDESQKDDESDESTNRNQLMVSIHELLNRPPPKQSNNISFKHRSHSSRKNHSAKKRSNPANDLPIVSEIRPNPAKDVDSPAPPEETEPVEEYGP